MADQRASRALLRFVETVVGSAPTSPDMWPSLGLIDGKLGAAIAVHEFERAGLSGTAPSKSLLLEAALEQFNERGARPSLQTGMAGLGWCAEVLGFDELATDVESTLLDASEPWKADGLWSLQSGLAGFGIFSLRRRDKGRANEIISRVRQGLSERLQTAGADAWWATPSTYLAARGVPFNPSDPPRESLEFGVTHGIAGALSIAARLNAPPPELMAVLETTSRRARGGPDAYGWLWLDGQPLALNSFAWCTGDLGVGLTCWAAASRCKSPLESWFLEFGLRLAERIVRGERPGVADNRTVCCGLAGAVHAMNRWYQATGVTRFGEAALACADRLLEELAHDPTPPEGLMYGRLGHALVLLALTVSHPPEWDAPFGFDVGA